MTVNKEKDPSLHLIPLNPISKMPILTEDNSGFWGVKGFTSGGRISILPVGDRELVDMFQKGILQTISRLPSCCANHVVVGVSKSAVLISGEVSSPILIYMVVGEHMGDLDYNESCFPAVNALYHVLSGEQETIYTTEPFPEWIDHIIERLKKRTNWADFVNKTFEEKMTSLGYQREEPGV